MSGDRINFRFRLFAWCRILAVTLAAVIAIAAGGGFLLIFTAAKDLPKVPIPLRRIIETPPTEIMASNGQLLWSSGPAAYVSLDQVTTDFINAILATEDHLFWQHRGINKLRIIKALVFNLLHRGSPQGASTITQQLAKNLFFNFEKTYWRKFRELLVALQIEAQFSKRQILEAYINQISFGPGAKGVEQAARKFFGKSALELDLAEAALLAGLPKSPTRYNPLRHFEKAKKRQRVVLKRMVAVGFLTKLQAEQAWRRPLRLNPTRGVEIPAGYFVDWVLRILEKRYGADVVYHGGLKVTTTVDPRLQSLAQQAVSQGVQKLEENFQIAAGTTQRLQAALVAVQVNSGAVKAMVGGRDYLESAFNRALDARRQPGSGFKPFLYYATFESLQFTPATVMEDRPVRIAVPGQPDWIPRNFGRRHQGAMILQEAFVHSVNTVAAQLVQKVGPRAVVAVGRRCGIESRLEPVYSVALGTSEVSPLEMAGAFATFAGGGIRRRPFCIWKVEDAFGRILEEALVQQEKVLDPVIAYQVVDMMQAVVDRGTGRVIRRMGFSRPAAGKTGTTNRFRDAWFTGFTPNLSTAVWVGYDHGTSLKDRNGAGLTGGQAAAPIWARFMLAATAGEPPRPFAIPGQIVFINCDPVSGRLAVAGKGIRIALDVRHQDNRQPQPEADFEEFPNRDP